MSTCFKFNQINFVKFEQPLLYFKKLVSVKISTCYEQTKLRKKLYLVIFLMFYNIIIFWSNLISNINVFLNFKSDYGITLPSWTTKVYPTKLAEVTARSFVLNAYNDKMRKLKGGT